MLKIIEVHPAANPHSDYVVVQNQGLVTINLRGWAICTEDYLEDSPQQAIANMHVFREDVAVKPYARVVLFSGNGENGWVPTVDGRQAYCAFWGRTRAVWAQAQNVHVLQVAASRKVVPTAPETLLADAPPRRPAMRPEDRYPALVES